MYNVASASAIGHIVHVDRKVPLLIMFGFLLQKGRNQFTVSPTSGQHFTQATHKGTSDLNIQVTDYIPLPPNSEPALKLRLEKKKINSGYVDSFAQPHIGLNIM